MHVHFESLTTFRFISPLIARSACWNLAESGWKTLFWLKCCERTILFRLKKEAEQVGFKVSRTCLNCINRLVQKKEKKTRLVASLMRQFHLTPTSSTQQIWRLEAQTLIIRALSLANNSSTLSLRMQLLPATVHENEWDEPSWLPSSDLFSQALIPPHQ